ncbi:Na+/H+ antiporter subunit G [Corynebacterium choanae]|uniref:Putative monovalent cation/H+ antiporter subunit G n=1 Tax=Corynebacterium choanae TaxID=1862358 RepID=A0A3G6JBV7_9CORY|nr:Na+/H+ antiporter subunit G [Corynebacterium choanae]AZA14588.1 putative monovalent cation/H+ antiporter subunit G [Corynebacterium choanae]
MDTTTLAEIIIGVIVIAAALMVLTTAVAMWRSPNALTRANLMGPAVCVGLPLLIIGKLGYDIIHDGFSVVNLLRGIIAIVALLVVANVASYYVGRAVHGVEKNIIVIDPPKQSKLEKYTALNTPTLVHAGQTVHTARNEAIAQAADESTNRGRLSRRQQKRRHQAHHRDYNPFAPEKHPNEE